MKIAVCKIGANITFSNNNKSAANADILYFLRQLDIGAHDVTICTHKTRNTAIPARLAFKEIQQITDFNDFDRVLIFNGSVNFYGGAIDENLLALYRAMSKTDKPLIWVNTDGALVFRQLWPMIANREWAKDFNKWEFHIDPKQVVYLTQGANLHKVRKMLDDPKKKAISPASLIHYPLYQTILAKHEKFFARNTNDFVTRPFDLAFGGYTRNTHKRKKIEHYYNDPRFRNLLFGNLRGVKAPNAKLRAKCSYRAFVETMMYSKATVIIGDEYYNDNFFTLRMYEALLADNIIFIDKELDPRYEFYNKNYFYEYYKEFYVKNSNDIKINGRMYRRFTDFKKDIFKKYDYDRESAYLVSILEHIN